LRLDNKNKENRMSNSKAPLEVMVGDGKLLISIGLATLSKTVAYSLNNENLFDGTVTVLDDDEFAAAIAEQLRTDEDEGNSSIQQLLDNAALRAFENGAEGIAISREESEEDEDYAEN
jgi:hypothetical protein